MSDDKKMAAQEVAARDRIYGFLGINGSQVMKFINPQTFDESLEAFKKNPELLYLVKIMTICSVREVWDSFEGVSARSPVGTWTSIDGERQSSMQDPRAQVASMVTDCWGQFDGDEADCRIWVSSKIEELEKSIEGLENDSITAIAKLLSPAMELMLQVHRLFGPEKDDMLPRLEEVVKAYGVFDKLEDISDSEEYQKAVDEVVSGMEKLMIKNERRAKNG